MQKLGYLLVVILSSLLLAACTTEQAEPTEIPATERPTDGKAFVVGDIGTNPDELIPLWQPLADYLADNLSDYGYTHGEVAIAPDLDTMASMMARGEVDIDLDSSYPSIILSRESGAQIILRQWREGAGEYHSIFFALSESNLTTVDDLLGQVVAFDKAFSTSGYFLPSTYLINEGYELVEVSSPDVAVDEDKIGYVFSGEDVNTVNWVLSGRVVAGVTNNIVYDAIPEETRDALTIIAETQTLPRQLVVVSEDMDEEVVNQIIEILSTMDENERGQAILAAIDTVEFDELPQGIDAFRDTVFELLDIVEGA